MKLIIAGSRQLIPMTADLIDIMGQLNVPMPTEIVSGDCKGPDRAGEELANFLQIPCTKFPADWNKHGKSAGPIRNKEMAVYGDYLLAIWDGKSKGTVNMINNMTELNKPKFVYNNDGVVSHETQEPTSGSKLETV